MRTILWAAFIFAAITSWPADAGWLDVRHIVRTNDVLAVTHGEETERAYQAENWTFELYARRSAEPVDLAASNLYVCWYLTNPTNSALFHLISTGALVSATNGHVSFYAPPPETNLEPLRYRSIVRAYQPVDGTNKFIGTLDERYWTVRRSEDSSEFDSVPPVPSGAYWGYIGGNITNQSDLSGFITSLIPSETDPMYTAEKSRYATGTPLYAYTETDPLWRAASGAVWQAIASGSSTNAGIADAPSNGTLYARQSGAWVAVPTNSGTGSGGGGTTLRKSGIDLLGTYALGDGLVVNGSTVDVDAASVSGIAMDSVSNAVREVVGEMLDETNTASPASKGFVLSNLGESSFPPFAGGSGEYALMRTVSHGTTQTVWRIVRGQLANSLNASFKWTAYGVTNKFYANGTNEQTYTIPAGITQVVIKCFGAGGGFQASSSTYCTGGSSIQPLSVSPGQVLTLCVPTPGACNSSTGSSAGGWPGGGAGRSQDSLYRGGGGGGMAVVLVDTNILCIAAGGGGGDYTTVYGGNGGGLTGGNASRGGSGASQTSGYAYLQGGDTSATTHGGGGGAGLFGGYGGPSTSGAGGAGSGYVCNKYGYTYQGLLTGDADYESGIGVANAPGMIVILHDAPTEGE